MHVLYVIDSLRQGGAERSVVTLAGPLAERGVRLEIATLGGEGDDFAADARDGGAAVTPLHALDRADALRRLGALLAQRAPAVVHTTLFEANVAGRVAAARAGVPVVSSVVGTPYGPDHRRGGRVHAGKVRAAQALDAVTCRVVTRLHAPAGHVADVMAPRLRVPRDRFEIVPRARDLGALGEPSAARRDALRRQLGLAPDAAVLVAVARHEQRKGLDVLVAAAARLLATHPSLVVLVAGREGNATGALRAQVASLGVASQVRLLGHRDDVADLLAAADVFVLPSWREGLPGAVLEAMALGTPVVATDLAGTREALGPAHGVLVPPGEVAALADAVDGVLATPARAGDPAAARRRVAEHFHPAAVADAMLALWARACAAGPRRLPGPLGSAALGSAPRWPSPAAGGPLP